MSKRTSGVQQLSVARHRGTPRKVRLTCKMGGVGMAQGLHRLWTGQEYLRHRRDCAIMTGNVPCLL